MCEIKKIPRTSLLTKTEAAIPKRSKEVIKNDSFVWQHVQLSSMLRISQRLLSAAKSATDSRSAGKPARRKLKDAITLTPNAAEKIKSMLADRDPPVDGIRVGVRKRGCNGYSYTINYADSSSTSKLEEVINQLGVKVRIDPDALFYIVGSTMDYVESDTATEFIFQNPNAKGECGCGESFNV
eukprot:gb/GEZN01015407.1/.p1 GENE.gb/GEZN01015407.1/~~gb/GEZN01015407.1/.p1  ORF type:complete len:183 (+),score=14.03 gb/GEZN01015407.1/:101-649(+)